MTTTPPLEGQPAPDFDLPTDGGGRIRLSDFRGRPLVLYFYPKDDTSGCTKEAIGFTAAGDDFKAAGAKIVGVSKDSVASHDKFKATYGLNFALGRTKPGRSLKPMASGSRRACTAGSTWASSAPPS